VAGTQRAQAVAMVFSIHRREKVRRLFFAASLQEQTDPETMDHPAYPHRA
jgi:hypothetical protein